MPFREGFLNEGIDRESQYFITVKTGKCYLHAVNTTQTYVHAQVVALTRFCNTLDVYPLHEGWGMLANYDTTLSEGS